VIRLEYDLNININTKNVKEGLKEFFFNINSTEIFYDENLNSYSYSFIDNIINEPIELEISFKFSDDDKKLESITMIVKNDKISEYDLEHYYHKIYKALTKYIVYDNEKQYLVRIYQYIYHMKGFTGEYNISYKNNKIRFKSLFNERYKNEPLERVIAFDCEVKAHTINQARSKALNIVKETVTYLSVLLGVGFYDVITKYVHIIAKEGEGLSHQNQQKAFFDPELELIVKNNTLGLKTLSYREEVPFVFLGASEEPKGLIFSPENENMKELENIFLNRKFTDKNTNNLNYVDHIERDVFINSDIKIPRCIRKFYKSLSDTKKLNIKEQEILFNSCKLYNMALNAGRDEPTLMISLFVSSIEVLSKLEKLSFSEFVKKYSDDQYSKEFCDFLYGNLRSGFLHSGETYFKEYDCNLDIALESSFVKSGKIFLKSKELLRTVFINWIETNMLNGKE
jgi:hypothetical protein psyrptA_25895